MCISVVKYLATALKCIRMKLQSAQLFLFV